MPIVIEPGNMPHELKIHHGRYCTQTVPAPKSLPLMYKTGDNRCRQATEFKDESRLTSLISRCFSLPIA